MKRRKKSRIIKNPTLRHLSGSLVLCVALFALWYIVMALTGWYDARFHVLATCSSAVMVGTGKSWGVIEHLVN